MLTKTQKYNSLSIDEKKWDSIISKREESLNIEIDNIRFNEYDLIIDNNNNKIYYSIINENDSSYNPSVSYKTDDKIKLVILKDELNEDKVGDYEFKIMIYNDSTYRIYSLICTRFPILNIISKDQKNDSRKQSILMKMYFFDNLQNSSNRIIKSDGILNIENDNYKMHLEVLSPGRNIRDNVISIMGMETSSRYDLIKVESVGEDDNVKYEDNHLIELFIDNKYKGIYKIEVMK